MYYVYILQSINNPDSFYIGFTTDLKQRLAEHNSGKSIHTNKYRPWRIKNYFAFGDEQKAKDFESYFKTHSGRKFCKNHF
ncbi:MAG: GIY-YIG nuclease family protein [Alphaproteobacteria bacterium]|nr:GIY-YIG nuclease family protein [Alphaproteobacteria bacterium]